MTAAYNVAAQVAAGNMGAPAAPPIGGGYGAPPAPMAPQHHQAPPPMPGMMVPTPMMPQQQQQMGGPPQQQPSRAPPPPPSSVAPAASFNPAPATPPPIIPQRVEQPAYGANAPTPPPLAQAYGAPQHQQQSFQPGPPQPSTFAPAPPPMQQQPAAAPPPPPAAPAKPQPPANCSVETVDTSKISPDLAPVAQSLRSLYDACAAAAAAHPAKRKEMDDSSRRLGVLLWKLNAAEVSPSVVAKLKSLAEALDTANFTAAHGVQMALTTGDWDECSAWLTALKRLTKFRSTFP